MKAFVIILSILLILTIAAMVTLIIVFKRKNKKQKQKKVRTVSPQEALIIALETIEGETLYQYRTLATGKKEVDWEATVTVMRSVAKAALSMVGKVRST